MYILGMVIKNITDPIPRNPSSMNLGWDLDISILIQLKGGYVTLPQVKVIIQSHS